MTKIDGKQVRELIEGSRYGVTEIALAMGIGKTGQTTLSHTMVRGCSQKYYNRIKFCIEHMEDSKVEDATRDFVKKMDVLFTQYKKDGCLDDYILEDEFPEFAVSAKDASYVWAAIDGAIHLYNLEHGTTLSFDQSYNEMTERYSFIISE